MPARTQRRARLRCALRHAMAIALSCAPLAGGVVAGEPKTSADAEPSIRMPASLGLPADRSTLVADRSEPRPAAAARNADDRIHVVKKANSSRAARKAAIEALPLQQMAELQKRRLLQVVNDTSMFRELPTLQFEVDPRVYRFFIDHPDVAVSIWRVMQISEFQMQQTAATQFETNDGAGTGGVIDLLYKGENECVVICDGNYKTPLLPKPIQASGALHLQSRFEKKADGKTYVTHTGRIFVQFPSQTIDTAAKIMSPVSYSIIDQNFREVSLFAHMMSMAMQRQPGWVQDVSRRLDGVLNARRGELMDVTAQVYADANPDAARRRQARLREADAETLPRTATIPDESPARQ